MRKITYAEMVKNKDLRGFQAFPCHWPGCEGIMQPREITGEERRVLFCSKSEYHYRPESED